MQNPFDRNDSTFCVLMNEYGQYSLWPTFARQPKGWRIVFNESTRLDCLSFIESQWTQPMVKAKTIGLVSNNDV